MSYATSAPGQGSSASTAPPTCQNCSTSTTPLWRRDEGGSVLCNACGLFLKLHGRARPISLKTDVIKSRNRVKTGQNGQKKKSLPGQGLPGQDSDFDSSPLAQNAAPRVPSMTQVQVSDTDERHEHKPISRSTTPSGTHVAAQLQHHHSTNIAPLHMFEAATLESEGRRSLDNNYSGHTPYYPATARNTSPTPQSILNGLRSNGGMDDPDSSKLKMRISELEVINELFRGRVQDLEGIEKELRQQVEEGAYREQELRRRIQELEGPKIGASQDDPERQSKRPRTSDFINEDADAVVEPQVQTQEKPSGVIDGNAPPISSLIGRI